MTTFATRAADTFLPPALSSTGGYCASVAAAGLTQAVPGVVGNNVTQLAVTNVAARAALSIGAGKKGYITIQNLSTSAGTAFVAFKLGAAAATITTTTGWEIPIGTSVSFYLDSDIVNDIETIGASTATLKYYVSSVVE
jgi:hypothetical protein